MFGCFDECFNYLAGYFILDGKILYKDYFFNHQMLMPYISTVIQFILHPESIYHLVLYHRMFIFLLSVFMSALLIFRFGAVGVGFVLLFEATKFYFMGSLFIPESIVVYLLVYLLGVVWSKLTDKKIYLSDYILSGFFSWAVVFLREPYIIVALLSYVIILWGKIRVKEKYVSLGIFVFLSLITLVFTDLRNYLYQVGIVNFQILATESKGISSNMGILKIFFYPIYIFIDGKLGYLRNILMLLSVIFLASFAVLSFRFRKIKACLAVLTILSFSNIRFVPPGTTFYEAFHMLSWYGLFIMSTLLFIRELFNTKRYKQVSLILIFFFVSLIVYTLMPGSFFEENIHGTQFYRNREFKLEFDKYLINGEAIRLLSTPNDTLFVDVLDYLVYWQAKLDSPYKYTIYLGPDDDIFVDARLEMFRKTPPDFYYYSCSDKQYSSPYLPDFVVNDYAQLYYIDRPSCLYIRKTKLSQISYDRWDNLKILRFYLPKTKI